MTTGRLSDDERAGLDRDGYVVRHCVFAPTEIAEIVSECEALVADLVRDRYTRRFPVGSYVFDPDFLRAGVIKVFGDGVMEYPAQTAALLNPYFDENGKPTKHSGELYFDPQRFARLVQKLDAAGLTVHIHAIGDRAVRTSLDAFAAARVANGNRDNRHQIAHLQLVNPPTSRASRS